MPTKQIVSGHNTHMCHGFWSMVNISMTRRICWTISARLIQEIQCQQLASHQFIPRRNQLTETRKSEPVQPVELQYILSRTQFLCFLVFTSFLLLFVSASHYAPPNNAATEATASVISSKSSSQKVDLALYYEALCPYCKDFIVGPLANAVETDLMTIVNLKLVPWGNAVIQNQTIQCQHGEDECYLNTIEACAINLWPDVKTHFNFIKCVEKQTASKNGVDTAWKSCADQLGLPQDDIKQCYDSGHGKELLLNYANITDHLHPPHEYVPWVVVGTLPLLDDFEKFVDYTCEAYKGKPLPKACSSHHTNSAEKKRLVQPVCHANEAASTKNPKLRGRKLEPHA